MSIYVYILINHRKKIYIGQTNNIERRMKEHNDTGTGYTSKYRPWTLIYSEKVDSRSIALQREKYYKSGTGRNWIRKNILRG